MTKQFEERKIAVDIKDWMDRKLSMGEFQALGNLKITKK